MRLLAIEPEHGREAGVANGLDLDVRRRGHGVGRRHLGQLLGKLFGMHGRYCGCGRKCGSQLRRDIEAHFAAFAGGGINIERRRGSDDEIGRWRGDQPQLLGTIIQAFPAPAAGTRYSAAEPGCLLKSRLIADKAAARFQHHCERMRARQAAKPTGVAHALALHAHEVAHDGGVGLGEVAGRVVLRGLQAGIGLYPGITAGLEQTRVQHLHAHGLTRQALQLVEQALRGLCARALADPAEAVQPVVEFRWQGCRAGGGGTCRHQGGPQFCSLFRQIGQHFGPASALGFELGEHCRHGRDGGVALAFKLRCLRGQQCGNYMLAAAAERAGALVLEADAPGLAANWLHGERVGLGLATEDARA